MLAPKKDRTRAQILNAAQQLFMEKNSLEFNFRDISYQAEMAIGTVYNYYKDLEAVYQDLVRIHMGAYHKSIDKVAEGLNDPIEIIVASTQQTLFCAAPGGSLGKLVFEQGLAGDEMIESIKQRFMADIGQSIQSGLIAISRPDIMLSMATGAMYSAMKDIYLGRLAAKDIEMITSVFFRLLGLRDEQLSPYLNKTYKLQALPPMPMSAIDFLPPMASTN